jgi:hypothetical protein
MFDWLRKRGGESAPAKKTNAPRPGENPANPGIGSMANWTFKNGLRTWQEPMNLMATLERLLTERGRTVRVEGSLVFDLDSQLSLRPLLSNMQPGQNGTQTSTTIEIKHPTRILSPIFEYQHSAGPNLEESLMFGFRQWYDSDFLTLLDAMRDKGVDCMELSTGERRVTLGPLILGRQLDLPPDDSDHPPCPCCLFTKTKDAFQPLVDSPGFQALRLYAARDQHGRPIADCRVNGEDYPAGKQGLIEYVRTWKSAGVESRKQYVLIQDQAQAVAG